MNNSNHLYKKIAVTVIGNSSVTLYVNSNDYCYGNNTVYCNGNSYQTYLNKSCK